MAGTNLHYLIVSAKLHNFSTTLEYYGKDEHGGFELHDIFQNFAGTGKDQMTAIMYSSAEVAGAVGGTSDWPPASSNAGPHA